MFRYMKKWGVLLLSLCLILCMASCGDAQEDTAPTGSASASGTTAPAETAPWYPDNIMAHYECSSLNGFGNSVYGHPEYTRDDITVITFLDTLADMPSDAWDVSENQDGSVMAWVIGTELYVAGEGGVTLPANSQCVFATFENVTDIHFNDCLYTDLVVDMNGFFQYCVSLQSLDLSNFRTGNAEKMANLFNHCESLTELDVSMLDTTGVRTMSQMFCGCYELTELDLSTFRTNSLIYVKEMFTGCGKLTSIDLSSFSTGRVTDFGSMFSKCTSLTSLDLSGFDFSVAESTRYMFSDCSSLTDIGCTITLPEGCDTQNMYAGSGLE